MAYQDDSADREPRSEQPRDEDVITIAHPDGARRARMRAALEAAGFRVLEAEVDAALAIARAAGLATRPHLRVQAPTAAPPAALRLNDHSNQVVLVSPCNPTGVVLPAADIERAAAMTAAAGAWLVLDNT